MPPPCLICGSMATDHRIILLELWKEDDFLIERIYDITLSPSSISCCS